MSCPWRSLFLTILWTKVFHSNSVSIPCLISFPSKYLQVSEIRLRYFLFVCSGSCFPLDHMLWNLSGSPGLPCACGNVRYTAGILKYFLDEEVYSGSTPVRSTGGSELNKTWPLARRLSHVGMKIPGNFWKWFCWSSSRGWLICHPGEGIRTSNH